MSYCVRPVEDQPACPAPLALRRVGSMAISARHKAAQIAQRPDGSVAWLTIPDGKGRVHVFAPGGKHEC